MKVRFVCPNFDNAIDTITDLLKVGCMNGRRQALLSLFLVTTRAYTQ